MMFICTPRSCSTTSAGISSRVMYAGDMLAICIAMFFATEALLLVRSTLGEHGGSFAAHVHVRTEELIVHSFYDSERRSVDLSPMVAVALVMTSSSVPWPLSQASAAARSAGRFSISTC